MKPSSSWDLVGLIAVVGVLWLLFEGNPSIAESLRVAAAKWAAK